MYRESKTIEAATYVLARAATPGEGVPYVKLIKLLYLADREQVLRKGRTISGDTHWSMTCGPILGKTLSAMRGSKAAWIPFVGVDPDAKVVWLKSQAELRELSRADCRVLDEISDQFGHLAWEELVGYTNRLPVLKRAESQTRRFRIRLEDLARGVGHSEGRILAIVEEDKEKQIMREFLSEFKSAAQLHA